MKRACRWGAARAALMALALLAACDAKPRQAPLPKAAAPAESGTRSDKVDIGTVEQSVTIELSIAEVDLPQGVALEELRTPRRELTMVTASVPAPAPSQLIVSATVRSSTAFIQRPVAGRATIYREQGLGGPGTTPEPLGTFNFVLGRYANVTQLPDGTPRRLPETQVDAFAGLQTPPDTMLLYAKAELIYLPEGTDEASVDPATATAAPADTTMRMSNPLRINIARAPERGG
jgi:hypothetical protein